MLSLYRDAIRLRRELLHHDESFAWLPNAALSDADDVLAFARGDGFVCVANLGDHPVPLPPARELLLASTDVDDGMLPPDAAAWLVP
jgi:alpha-glucosidase